MTTYDAELAKTRRDIAALETLAAQSPRDAEKRVRLAYRQFHLASMTGNGLDFDTVAESLSALLRDFGPKEDICLLKANLDDLFHRLDSVKEDLRSCPALARRFEGRSILAEIDFQEGRYAQARAGFERLIEERRTWENLARLANWHGKMGGTDEADQLYSAAEDELTAKEMRCFAWLELQRGALALGRGLLEKARTHYGRAASSFPGDWRTDEHLAGLACAESNFDQAEALLSTVLARVPKPELKQALGEMLAFMGRKEEAQPWLDQAEAAYLASANKGAVHYYHHLADFYAEAGGQPAEAVKWARKDVALRPNFSTQSALAWALCQNGECDEGLEWVKLALASGAQDSGVYGTAAALFRAAGDNDRGASYARAVVELNPQGNGFHLHH